MEKKLPFDEAKLQELNEKAIRSQLFTPDNLYIELGLIKDFSLGAINFDVIVLQQDQEKYNALQPKILEIMEAYQTREYDTVEPYFESLGYNNEKIDAILNNTEYHDQLFTVSPVSNFFRYLSRHMLRNQNNSRPAKKYTRKDIGPKQFVIEAMPVTATINTYPLTISPGILQAVAVELGEALGVNIRFINKNPATFDKSDWDSWMESIDCFYIDNLTRFSDSDFVISMQHELQFVGSYWFVRKRFGREREALMVGHSIEEDIKQNMAILMQFCDFEWITNYDLRLLDGEDDVSMEEPSGPESDIASEISS